MRVVIGMCLPFIDTLYVQNFHTKKDYYAQKHSLMYVYNNLKLLE